MVTPVPPLATFSVPATTIFPAVAVPGVRPVEPKLTVFTPAETEPTLVNETIQIKSPASAPVAKTILVPLEAV